MKFVQENENIFLLSKTEKNFKNYISCKYYFNNYAYTQKSRILKLYAI